MKVHEIFPKKGVGDVLFESDISVLKKNGYIENISGFDDVLKWHTYTKSDGMEFYVKDNEIVCIACFSNCYFQGEDLIGKTAEQVVLILGNPDEIGDNVWVSEEIEQTPYEYFSYGLQIWVESGKVVSVFCNAVY